jgi:hypothetical protein
MLLLFIGKNRIKKQLENTHTHTHTPKANASLRPYIQLKKTGYRDGLLL